MDDMNLMKWMNGINELNDRMNEINATNELKKWIKWTHSPDSGVTDKPKGYLRWQYRSEIQQAFKSYERNHFPSPAVKYGQGKKEKTVYDCIMHRCDLLRGSLHGYAYQSQMTICHPEIIRPLRVIQPFQCWVRHLTRLKHFCTNHGDQRIFSIWNQYKFLLSCFRFIWICMLWAYGNYKYFYSYSAGIDFSRQNLTSVDVRFWCLKSIPVL